LLSLEKCVAQSVFKTIGHSLKNLGPSQKTLCPPWCSKLVTGLTSRSLSIHASDIKLILNAVAYMDKQSCCPHKTTIIMAVVRAKNNNTTPFVENEPFILKVKVNFSR